MSTTSRGRSGTNLTRENIYLVSAFLVGYENASTRTAHKANLVQWLGFLHQLEPRLEPISDDVRKHHVDAYARWLQSKGLSNGTVFHKISSIAVFYAYLRSERFVVFNPTDGVRRPKVDRESNRDWLHPRQLEDFIRAGEREGGTVAALVALLGLNALRISEALGADVEHLGQDRHHHTLLVTRKGGHREQVPLHPRALDAVAGAVGDRETGPILLNQNGKRMKAPTANEIIRRLAEPIAPRKHITAHSLRHSSITADLLGGADITQAQEHAGHVDPRTTAIYDRRAKRFDGAGAYRVATFLSNFSYD